MASSFPSEPEKHHGCTWSYRESIYLYIYIPFITKPNPQWKQQNIFLRYPANAHAHLYLPVPGSSKRSEGKVLLMKSSMLWDEQNSHTESSFSRACNICITSWPEFQHCIWLFHTWTHFLSHICLNEDINFRKQSTTLAWKIAVWSTKTSSFTFFYKKHYPKFNKKYI